VKGSANLNANRRYFIGSDGDHQYVVPLDILKQWEEWRDLPSNDERTWDVPAGAERLDGGLLTFCRPAYHHRDLSMMTHFTDGSECWCDPEKRPDGVIVHRQIQ
jgi:hypothetical protein